MHEIILCPDFDTPQDEIREAVVAAQTLGEKLYIDFVIVGQFGLIDTQELAQQFLYAASIGEAIAGACSKFECKAPSSIHAHESVEFCVVPANVDEFMVRLWERLPARMSHDFLAQNGYGEDGNIELVNECWNTGWDLLDSPEQAPHTSNLIEHAQAMLRAAGYDEEE